MIILLAGHKKVSQKKICLSGVKYDVRTSKMIVLSDMVQKCMSKRIF